MDNIYITGDYLETTQTWHAEDSSWKAKQIIEIMNKNGLQPKKIAEVGCGAGQILGNLSRHTYLHGSEFQGYDISPQAIELCKKLEGDNLKFFCKDIFASASAEHFDVLLLIDVFEHVPDYMGFIEKARIRADYKIYHIPLDIHISSVLRNSFIRNRYSIGHLHYFTADSAIDTLRDTGHEVVDFCYTNGALELFSQHPSLKTAIANVPRWLFAKFNLAFTARVFGGYSLLVLTK